MIELEFMYKKKNLRPIHFFLKLKFLIKASALRERIHKTFSNRFINQNQKKARTKIVLVMDSGSTFANELRKSWAVTFNTTINSKMDVNSFLL